MKSPYYVATVVNAYKKAVEEIFDINTIENKYQNKENNLVNDNISQRQGGSLQEKSYNNDTKYQEFVNTDDLKNNQSVINDSQSQKCDNMNNCTPGNINKKLIQTEAFAC